MKNFLQNTLIGFIVIGFTACGSLASLDGTTSVSNSGSSDESDAEAAYTSAIETLIDSNSSSSVSSSSISALVNEEQTNASYITTGTKNLRLRYRCDDDLSATETFSCDSLTGIMTRTVTFDDCELSNSHRDVTLNGSFTNEVTNGGDGMCNIDNTIDFSKMVMGFTNDDDEFLNATHQHDSDESGMVYSFTNKKDKEVVVTRTSTRTLNFSNAVDENEDGSAESVTQTNTKEFTFLHTVDGSEVHNVTVSTTDDDFVSVTTDEETDEETESTIELSIPTHTLTFNDDGELSGRVIESGNLITDHNRANIRMVFGVGEEGLTFDDGTTCGPVEGTLTVTGYTINDDDSYGAQVATGTIVFSEGEVQSAEYDGVQLTLRPRPCH